MPEAWITVETIRRVLPTIMLALIALMLMGVSALATWVSARHFYERQVIARIDTIADNLTKRYEQIVQENDSLKEEIKTLKAQKKQARLLLAKANEVLNQ